MDNKKFNIVISAYACSPNWGSEPGMAWNWVKNLSNYYNIYLITNTEFKEELLEGVRINNLESSIKIYFNDIGEKATMMGKNQGDWRFYYYYRKCDISYNILIVTGNCHCYLHSQDVTS